MLEALAAPFPPATVSWRVGPTNADKTKGMALAYIDARDVMRRLDEVCGPGGWQNDYPWSDGKRVVCRIGIKIGEEWVWKADGAGDTDTEGEKGALSDAFKRAAVHWGIGRYLYDTEAPWVQIVQKGRSYVIAESEMPRLARLLAAKAPAFHGGTEPVDEDPDRRLARKEMALLLAAFRAAPNIPAIDDPTMGLWAVNKEAVERIKQYGGIEAIAKLDAAAKERAAILASAG